MPTRSETNFPRLINADEFESLIRDICALEWNDPHTEKFGRKGQKQYGVDVYGQPVDGQGKYRGSQCKLRTQGKQLTEQELETEIIEAKKFPHELDRLIIVTDTPRDKNTQVLVDQISIREISNRGFNVSIWFWDNITERLAAYPKLIVKYYPDYFANLTTLPTVEGLIDTPLQVVSIVHPLNSLTLLEERLKFRGIRILRSFKPEVGWAYSALSNVLPDGAVCSYNSKPESKTIDSTLLKFTSNVQTLAQQLENPCRIFVILPSLLVAQFMELFKSLDGDPQRVQILTTELPLDDAANTIFQAVFHYGYTRRGGMVTMDIAVRTHEGRPSSVLLDLDWQTKLSTSRFPAPEEWKTIFMPAVTAVHSQLLNQSDRARIQISCQLPLPAAFALGYFFNIRLARIGVWARKTEVSDFKHQFWLSDSEPAEAVFKPEWIKHPDSSGRSAVVELTSYVTIHKAVESFMKELGTVQDAWLQMRLERDGKPIANIDEGYAVAFANQVGQTIRHLNEQGITNIHLFARIPSPLAVLIGQRLQACGCIHLYWFDNPTYRFAFTLT